MKRLVLAGAVVLQASSGLAEYVWPSKYDYIEDVMMLHSGYIHNGFSDAVNPCSFGTNVVGRQNAAEWVRTGYHDMATHDAAAGTGGLDASILFELDRDENVGSAFNNTFGFLSNYYNIRASSSDLLALAVVTATYRCNGPKIPFRAGRIDATEAGPLGVPKPDEDVETHTNRFATAGFNTSDMIAMVACGHTLGGVHGVDFPEITGNSSEAQVSFFEGSSSDSSSEFDNAVVTQYLDNSTDNPLVSGSNDTTNSDKRVFGVDGNTTMHALADPATFQTTCADILERMINAVPSTVTLSEVIDPIDIKPYMTTFALNSNGTIDFVGRIRVRVSDGTNRNTNDLAVHLTYADRDGTNTTTTITATHPSFQGGTSSGLFRENFSWYEFATVLDPSTGISKFHVHITTPSTGAAQVFDNAGNGFPLDDSILYQQSQSCLDPTIVDGNMNLTVSAFVRNDRIDEVVTLNLVHKVPRQGVIMPALEVHSQVFDKTSTEKSGYVLFQAKRLLPSVTWNTAFDVVLGEGDNETIVENQSTSAISDNICS